MGWVFELRAHEGYCLLRRYWSSCCAQNPVAQEERYFIYLVTRIHLPHTIEVRHHAHVVVVTIPIPETSSPIGVWMLPGQRHRSTL